MKATIILDIKVKDEGVPVDEIRREIKKVSEKAFSGRSAMYSYTSHKKVPIFINVDSIDVISDKPKNVIKVSDIGNKYKIDQGDEPY